MAIIISIFICLFRIFIVNQDMNYLYFHVLSSLFKCGLLLGINDNLIVLLLQNYLIIECFQSTEIYYLLCNLCYPYSCVIIIKSILTILDLEL